MKKTYIIRGGKESYKELKVVNLVIIQSNEWKSRIDVVVFNQSELRDKIIIESILTWY